MIENKNKLVDKQLIEEKSIIENKNIIKKWISNIDNQEKSRIEEINKRSESVQKKLSKMAETVFNNTKATEIKEERKLLAMKLEKENNDLKDEKYKRIKIINQRKLVQGYLKKQTKDKRDVSNDNREREITEYK